MNERRKETLNFTTGVEQTKKHKMKLMLLNNLKRHFCSNIITTTTLDFQKLISFSL